MHAGDSLFSKAVEDAKTFHHPAFGFIDQLHLGVEPNADTFIPANRAPFPQAYLDALGDTGTSPFSRRAGCQLLWLRDQGHGATARAMDFHAQAYDREGRELVEETEELDRRRFPPDQVVKRATLEKRLPMPQQLGGLSARLHQGDSGERIGQDCR